MQALPLNGIRVVDYSHFLAGPYVGRCLAALGAEGVPVYVRRPRGRDIYAACGQLKRTVEG